MARHKAQHLIGKEVEQMACHFLQTKGLYLIKKNYHCFQGEIDLIMGETDNIVFVEVRSRSRTDYGTAIESINKSKRNKLAQAAASFLHHKNWSTHVHCRFDVVAIELKMAPLRPIKIEWIKNAFTAQE